MKRSEQIGELVAALAKAQSEFTQAVKESDNPYYGSKYADLAAVIGAVRPALNKNGIAMMHTLESDLERQVAIVTAGLYHGEQFMEFEVEAPATAKGKDGQPKFDVQSIGAAWSYLRRYTLQALCGLASEDDDGNSLQNDNKPIPKKQVEPKPPATQETSFFFSVSGDRMTCTLRGILEKETREKKAKYLNVTFHGYYETFNFATCFDTNLFNALIAGVDKECVLKLKYEKGDKFLNITDVLSVAGVEYANGKPAVKENPDAVANS
jgi:hypothetical protein